MSVSLSIRHQNPQAAKNESFHLTTSPTPPPPTSVTTSFATSHTQTFMPPSPSKLQSFFDHQLLISWLLSFSAWAQWLTLEANDLPGCSNDQQAEGGPILQGCPNWGQWVTLVTVEKWSKKLDDTLDIRHQTLEDDAPAIQAIFTAIV